MVAVAEIATGHVSSAGGAVVALGGQQRPVRSRARFTALSLAVASCWGVMLPQAFANPSGGVVVAGQASMVTTGNRLLVTTLNAAGTNHSAINWQSFSIPTGNTTFFQQPNASSTSINRVVTNTPSQLFGTLGSNGNLVLVNQSGITVGKDAVVDTAGFTASSLKMSDADVTTGRLRFGDGSAGDGSVSVLGSVLARNGDVVLLGRNVATGKDALIQAPNGATLLAAGQQVEITGRGLEGISLQVQAPSNEAVNLGTLRGDAVGIFAGTLKHSGLIQSSAVSVGGGKVVLKASDTVIIGGSASAVGQGGAGGSIRATANKIALLSTASLNVSSDSGGGEILVGGGWQGKDASITNADQTVVATGAQLRADALVKGDGGTVVVWADGSTRFGAQISARGGATGGNGGAVEVSGKQFLDFLGGADSSAPLGIAGTLLLDPDTLTIGTFADINGDGNSSPDDIVLADSPFTAGATGYGSQITAAQVGSLLSTNNLSLAATGDVTVIAPIPKTSGPDTSLTLTSTSGNVVVNAPISAAGFGLAVALNANGANGNVTIGAKINAGSGAVKVSAGNSITIGRSGSITSTAGGTAVLLNAANSNPNGSVSYTVGYGSPISLSAGSRWLAETSECDGICGNIKGLLGSGDFVQFNYSSGGSVLGAGNGVLAKSISASTLTGSALGGSVSKVYDGSTSISLTGASVAVPASSRKDVYSITSTSATLSGTGTLDTPDVGSRKLVTADQSGVKLGPLDTSVGIKLHGLLLETVNPLSGSIGTVNRAIASISLAGSRPYDGTNIVNASIFSLSGLVNGETLSLSGAGTISDKKVGTNKLVSLGSLALGDATGFASNYTLSGGTYRATITPVSLSGVTGITAANKVYDGTTRATLSGGTLSGVILGDSVALGPLSGTFIDKKVETGKLVNINAPVLTGSDAGNYTFAASALTSRADITAKAVDVSAISASNKVYDGTANATLSGGVLSGVISGDVVTVGALTGSFDNRNVGTGKAVSVSSILLTGQDAGNYMYASQSFTAKADITQRALSKWVGPAAGGNWSDSANWDALPDAFNVAAVELPSVGTVVYGRGLGTTNLQSISGTGILSMADGTLVVAGGLSLQGYSQSGGTLATLGAFNVASSYSQSGGTLVAGGPVAITQAGGDLQVGSITAPLITLTANGSISQTAGLVTKGLLSTQSGGGTILNSADNRVSSFLAASTAPGNIELTNVGVLDVRGIRTNRGNIALNNTGGISTSGPVVARGGRITGIANSPLTVGPDGVSADGDIVLIATNLTSAGDVTLNGPVESTGGAVAVNAANNLTQNSSILAAQGVTASVGGTLTFGPQATTGYQPVSYTANSLPVNPPRPPASNTVATDQVVALMQSIPDLTNSRDVAPIDTLLSTDKERDLSKELIVSEGQVCRP